MGEEAVYFAKLGASVTAMDISAAGIQLTLERAAHNGACLRASVGDVTETGLPDGSFDLIHGIGILHHVGIEAGLREANRLLAPGGIGVFSEHVSSSRLIDFFRSRYNRGRDVFSEYERPLSLTECASLKAAYNVAIEPWSLLYRLRRPLPFFGREAVLRFDRILVRAIPPLRRLCGAAILILRKSE
jgi:SAM-dependent methyltransferase